MSRSALGSRMFARAYGELKQMFGAVEAAPLIQELPREQRATAKVTFSKRKTDADAIWYDVTVQANRHSTTEASNWPCAGGTR